MVLAGVAVLAVACGDGDALAEDGRGDEPPTPAEVAALTRALADLDARIERLEQTAGRLEATFGEDSAALADLPILLEELRQRLALLEERSGAPPAPTPDEGSRCPANIPGCPEDDPPVDSGRARS